MSNSNQFGGGAAKGVQRGVITVTGGTATGSATITSVNTAKTELRFLGYTAAVGDVAPYLTLHNSTTVRATLRSVATGGDQTLSWELTEFY